MKENPVTDEKFLVQYFLDCDPLVGEPAVYEVYHHPDPFTFTCTCGVTDEPCVHIRAVSIRIRQNGGVPVAKTRALAVKTAPISVRAEKT